MDLDVALLAFLCLGGFAGVRTAEIVRMNWEDINWVDGHIGVLKPKQVTRWRPRNVTMLPVFRRHLEPFALKGRTDLSKRRAAALRTPQPAGEGFGAKGLAGQLPASQLRDVSRADPQRLSQIEHPDGSREPKHDALQIWHASRSQCR